MRKLDLMVVALALALLISWFLSQRFGQLEAGRVNAAPSVLAGDGTNRLPGSQVQGTGTGQVDPSTIPTPAPDDVSVDEDVPQELPGGGFRVTGTITNRNATWAVELLELPRIQVLDPRQQVVDEGEVDVEARVVPPRGSVRWSYQAEAGGRTAVSFQRTGVRGKWVLPDPVRPGS